MNLIIRREQNVAGYLARPLELRKSCDELKPGDRATMCPDHPSLGFMCLECFADHWGNDHLSPTCDAHGGPAEYEDFCEAYVAESSTPTWYGVVDVKVRWLCVDCANRLYNVRVLYEAGVAALTGVVKLWLEADAPGHELADRFGWCVHHPEEIRAYEQLFTHFATEHDPGPMCDACGLEPGTVPRGAVEESPHGPVFAPLVAIICEKCNRAEKTYG